MKYEKDRHLTDRRKPKLRRGQIVSIVAIAVVGALFLTPLLYMLTTSLKPKKEVLQNTVSLFGSYFAVENYTRAWTAFPFGKYLFNSILVGLVTSLLTVITSAMAAYAFARLKFKHRDGIFFIYLATLMIPLQVTIIPLYIILRTLGWHDSYTALIIPPAFTAFGVFMLRQFFLTIPTEIEEAAKIDGCSRFQIFTTIILPMSKPGLASLAIFTFVNSWKSFFWPLIVTATDAHKTLPLGLYMFSGQYGTDWSALMAATAISIIPGVIFYIIFQRSLVQGISLSGMGGR